MDSLNRTAIAFTAILLPDIETMTLVQAAAILVVLSVTIASTFHAAYFFCRAPTSSSRRISALGTLASVLLYCYLADRTLVFRKSEKLVDETTFIYLCLLALASGVATVHRNPLVILINDESQDNATFELLPRQQTEEWKGWMQIAILLYHYCGMSRVLHVYRLVRILVGSYLFLTGYGHTIYFLRTNDFSLHRVVSVLTRLNLLASLLPFVMGSKYDMYYFPALSTFWFLVTWAVVPRTSRTLPWRTIPMRILFAIFSIELLLSMPAIWHNCAYLMHTVKAVDLDASEFLFRLSLDRYVPHVGILAACVSEHVRRSAQPTCWSPHFKQIAVMAGFCLLAAYFLFLPALDSKEESNRYHPVTEIAPILAFVLLRNSHPTLRKHRSRLFSWVGRHSLETFVLQYHIWLAADAKKILYIFWCSMSAASPVAGTSCWIERCLISALFLLASYGVSRSTSILTVWLVGSRESAHSNGVFFPPFCAVKWSNPDATLGWKRIFRADLKQRFMLLLLLLWLLNVIW